MKTAPLSEAARIKLEAQLSQLTTQIRNHTGTNTQLERIRRRRNQVSNMLFDDTVRLRSELMQPSQVLEQIREGSGLSKEADHALQIAVELFKVASLDEIEYVNRRVSRHAN